MSRACAHVASLVDVGTGRCAGCGSKVLPVREPWKVTEAAAERGASYYLDRDGIVWSRDGSTVRIGRAPEAG